MCISSTGSSSYIHDGSSDYTFVLVAMVTIAMVTYVLVAMVTHILVPMVTCIAVLMIRVEKCTDIYFPIVNLLISPLIMYSKFVWSNYFGWSNTKVGQKMSDDWLLP